MPLKHLQIRHPFRVEMRSQQLTARVPRGSIRREDAVAEKGLPVMVEALAFAVIAKLRGENGLHVLRIDGEDAVEAGHGDLRRRRSRRAAVEEGAEGLEIAVAEGIVDC